MNLRMLENNNTVEQSKVEVIPSFAFDDDFYLSLKLSYDSSRTPTSVQTSVTGDISEAETAVSISMAMEETDRKVSKEKQKGDPPTEERVKDQLEFDSRQEVLKSKEPKKKVELLTTRGRQTNIVPTYSYDDSYHSSIEISKSPYSTIENASEGEDTSDATSFGLLDTRQNDRVNRGVVYLPMEEQRKQEENLIQENKIQKETKPNSHYYLVEENALNKAMNKQFHDEIDSQTKSNWNSCPEQFSERGEKFVIKKKTTMERNKASSDNTRKITKMKLSEETEEQKNGTKENSSECREQYLDRSEKIKMFNEVKMEKCRESSPLQEHPAEQSDKSKIERNENIINIQDQLSEGQKDIDEVLSEDTTSQCDIDLSVDQLPPEKSKIPSIQLYNCSGSLAELPDEDISCDVEVSLHCQHDAHVSTDSTLTYSDTSYEIVRHKRQFRSNTITKTNTE